MSGLDAFIRRVVSALESLSIEYMVVGSFASSYHGPPRSTPDLDLVVGSERQRADVASIIAVRRSSLDLANLRRWADDLGVRNELESLLDPPST